MIEFWGCLMNRLVHGLAFFLVMQSTASAQDKAIIRSAQNGAWSAPATWEGNKVPGKAAKVQIRPGHRVLYDVDADVPIRFVHVAGTLTFAADRNTRLDVGLLKIQPGEECTEDGFDCDAHKDAPPADAGGSHTPQARLEVGTLERPIDAKFTARIRLVYFEGTDKQSLPAIVCCGGSMDFHGAPMSRTWLRLGSTARAGDSVVTLEEPVTGWSPGDRLILTATTRQEKLKKTFKPSVIDNTQTEEHILASVDGAKITLKQPLKFEHIAEGPYRGDVANLSRNVIVESADPKMRGHTMYHRRSAGSIRYAEFRHLGKEGVLGRYSLHYHLAGDTMRGSSVIGASIWDSGNRWLTIHGTNFLVVRDCVGYRSVGHGFFLEDGTEVNNILDRNLAIQALVGKTLPQQIIPFDKNDGSGFWWANCLNSFTRNVACDCDEYGYFFQAARTADFDPVLSVRQPDGTRKRVDIRTLPFLRFDDNEAHCQRRHGFNLGGGVPFGKPNVDGVGPDARHPFVVRNFRAWNVHWAIHPVSPSLLIENMDIHQGDYGIWRPVYQAHVYKDVSISKVPAGQHYAFVEGKPPQAVLEPVDDLPPVTVITSVQRLEKGKVIVRGTSVDNGVVSKVMVNGHEFKATASGEWEAVLLNVPPGALKLSAHAVDAAGNVEKTPHVKVID